MCITGLQGGKQLNSRSSRLHKTVHCQAAGAALSLIDSCLEAEAQGKQQGGSAKDVPAGFGICRPPGHHAVRQSCMGFCLFSTVAIAARYAQQRHGLQKVRLKAW